MHVLCAISVTSCSICFLSWEWFRIFHSNIVVWTCFVQEHLATMSGPYACSKQSVGPVLNLARDKHVQQCAFWLCQEAVDGLWSQDYEKGLTKDWPAVNNQWFSKDKGWVTRAQEICPTVKKYGPTDPIELFDIDLLQKQIPVYSKNGKDNYFDKTMCGCKSKSECTWDDRQRRHRDKKGFFKMIVSRLGH